MLFGAATTWTRSASMALLMTLGGASAGAQPPQQVKVLIGFPDLPGPAEEALVQDAGGQVRYRYHLVSAIAASVPVTALEGLRRNPQVSVVESDGQVRVLDVELDNAWGVTHIGAGIPHAAGNQGQGVKIAILDTGIDCTHPDLDGNCAGGIDFVNDDGDPTDDNGHGTLVGGIVAAEDNAKGVVGVAPKALLYAVKVLAANGSGSFSDIIAGIEWAADNGIQVTNNSYGTAGDPGSIVRAAFDNARAAGVVHVAAAGNFGACPSSGDTVIYPARYASVIAVAAVNNNDKRACFSSAGPKVDLSAPGVRVNSTRMGGGYTLKNGTSMASAHTVGVAALIIASGITFPAEVRQRLIDTAGDLGVAGKDELYGYGLVDADEAAVLGAVNAAPALTISAPATGARTRSTSASQATGSGGRLADTKWTAIPGSEMQTVYEPAIDGLVPQGHRSFEAIQKAWSGGVCVGNELFVWGGGHSDGANNSIFAVNVLTGAWRRVGPNPTTSVYTNAHSQTNPDGSPSARHTYDNLVSDGRAIYISSTTAWSDSDGTSVVKPSSPPPTGPEKSSWRFDLTTETWSNFAPSTMVTTHGAAEYANGVMYKIGKTTSQYDIASDTWTHRNPGTDYGAGTVLVYSPDSDRFYGLGGNQSWYRTSAQWLTKNRTNIPNETVSTGKHWGNTYYPPEHRVLLWHGGPSLITYNELTEAWETITPAGDPGPDLSVGGVSGRLSYCGGRVVLVNGTDTPLYYLALPGAPPPPPPPPPPTTPPPTTPPPTTPPTTPPPTTPPPTTPPPTTPPPTTPPPTPPPDLPPESTTLWPVMDRPPGGSLEAFDSWADEQCGLPRSQWPVLEVGPGKQYADTEPIYDAIRANGIAVVRIYSRPKPYPSMKLKGKKCVEVVGVGMPIVRGINATASYHDGEPVKPGGIIVRGVQIADGSLGIPNNQQFVVLEDSMLERSPKHGFITSPNAHHLYVRVRNSHLRQADSHVIYIDRAGRADIIDNVCESPGWGHCIRVVAHYGHVEGNTASNVGLDGVPIPRWNNPAKLAIGMHPIEVYLVSDGVVRNNTAIKWEDNQAMGVILQRGRTDFNYSDVEGKTEDGRHWIKLSVTDSRYQHAAFWEMVGADLDARGKDSRFAFHYLFEGNVTKTTGPHPRDGVGFVVNSGWPSHDPRERAHIKEELKAFVLANPGKTCAQLSALAPTPEMKWLFDRVRPPSVNSVCKKGILPEYIPRPAPDNWRERQYVTWGPGNQTLICPTIFDASGKPTGMGKCVPTTGCQVRKDDKQRSFFHPGDQFTHTLNPGGLRECEESNAEE